MHVEKGLVLNYNIVGYYLYSNFYGEENTMVSSINSDSLTTLLKQISAKSQNPEDDMFQKLSKDVGGDGKTITKTQLEDYIASLKSDTSGTADKGKLGFLEQLDKNWDKVSNGKDSITSADLKAGKSYLKPPSKTDSTSSLFSSLSDSVNAGSDGITKDDLVSYLKSLFESTTSKDNSSTTDSTDSTNTTSSTDSTSSSDELKAEMKLLTNLIVNFDSFASDNGKITSSSLLSALKEPQDPTTVTSSQLQSPIDLRV